MLTLLSPAKTMASSADVVVPFTSTPVFNEEANAIINQLSTYSVDELVALFKVSEHIAHENQLRYARFRDESGLTPAILAYTGVVFKNIDPSVFSEDDFNYAQNHIRIVSFCYGLLKPLDLIHNYRLEGKIVLNSEQETIFKYWRSRLTDVLIEDVKAQGGVLCNLASNEMQQMFDWKKVEREVEVVTPDFSEFRNGKRVTVAVHAKIARGKATHTIVKMQIEDPEKVVNVIDAILK